MHVTAPTGWTVRAVGTLGPDVPAPLVERVIPAAVPGSVHLDLLEAGLIPDPCLDRNEEQLSWIGRTDWRYEAEFHAADVSGANVSGAARVDLVALGLDTVARVEVNGQVVADTRNMHRSYRIPVAHLLRQGPNKIAVTFAAPVPAAERFSAEIGPRPHVNVHPFNSIRKMACNYGWDWGPDLATSGIWRPLEFEVWDTARIAAVRPLVAVQEDGSGVLTVHVDVERAPGQDGDLGVTVAVAGIQSAATIPSGASSTVLEIRVPDVQLWWPHGYGAQDRYKVRADLADGRRELDSWSGRVGFRTVRLNTVPDADGTPFELSVNGVRVFARGVNWIPDDPFPSRITRGRYAERLNQAREANVNLIRVWGGGIYESEDFYDLCDGLGLLVWQDFLLACAAYAEEEPLRGEIEAEAREAVTRLSPHPSLVLWNGCNENIWGHEDWGWKAGLGDRTWGWGYYTELLPKIVAELDPTRPYSPGSPYSFRPDTHPNEPEHGTMHIWDVWNQVDYTVYRDYRPRFVAEFGFQGPPAWATLTRAVHDDPRRPDSPTMLAHQKAEDGNLKLERGLVPHLGVPDDFDDWHWATSLNQARAVSLAIEHFRALSPLCAGAVVWQLNDMWPVTSWSAVDGDGRRKPLWYALRRVFADRMVTIQPRAGGLVLAVVNDSARPWSGTAEVVRRGFDGAEAARVSLRFDAAPRSAQVLPLPEAVAVAGDAARELVAADAGDDEVTGSEAETAYWFFAEDIDSALPPQELDVTAEAVADGYRLTVKSSTLVRDLAVLADRVAPDAVVDRMLVTLLPGQNADFHIRTAARVAPEAFADPLVLRSANQLRYP